MGMQAGALPEAWMAEEWAKPKLTVHELGEPLLEPLPDLVGLLLGESTGS